MRKDYLVLGGESVEFIICGDEILAGQLGYGGSDLYVKALGGVKSGTDGGSAQRQLLKLGQSDEKQLLVLLKACSPTGDLLREGDGGSVLKVGTSALYDAFILGFELLEGGDEQVDGGNNLVLDSDDGGDVHGGGEGVV